MGTQSNNFPVLSTTFVGRERELSEIGTAFGEARLLTLTGVGGTGKTRLALRHAADQTDRYPDGAWLIELASLTDPDNVPRALADVFGIRDDPGTDLTAALIDYLRDKRTLLVIDNCEHLLKRVSDIVEMILDDCPGVRILATSRESLRTEHEETYSVPSLPVPESDELGAIKSSAAVLLFVDRAIAVKAAFMLSDENSAAVAAICRRLDGIPLAIELAAARLKKMSVQAVLLWLNQKFTVLTGGTESKVKRHQTLRSLIDWSYDLLDESEKTVFNAVSVFRGGWTVESAVEVCTIGGIDKADVPDLLASLAGRSLLVPSEGRCGMLEAIREYAGERLNESGDERVVNERHSLAFVELCERAKPHFRGPEQAEWLVRIKDDHENIRTALARMCADREFADDALRLVAGLWPFWVARGDLTEGRQWCDTAIKNVQKRAQYSVWAEALTGSGTLAWLQADFPAATARVGEAIELFRKCDDQKGLAKALNILANVKTAKGYKQEAKEIYAESLAIRRRIGDRSGIGGSLNNLGAIAIEASELDLAKELLEESRDIFDEIGDRNYYGLALKNLGTVSEFQGRYAESLSLFKKSLEIYREVGDEHRAVTSQAHIATIYMKQGDIETARKMFGECLDFRKEIGDKRGHADLLGDLALIDIWSREYDSAELLADESLGMRRALGDQWGIASSLHYLGIIVLLQGRFETSCSLLKEGLALRESLDDSRGATYTRLWLGNASLSNGDHEIAKEQFTLALCAFREVHDDVGVAQVIEAFGRLNVLNCPGCAVRLLSYGSARRSELHSRHTPHEAEWNEEALAYARDEISEEFFGESWAEGREMSLDEAVHYTQR